MMFTRRTVLSITFGTMVAVVLDQRAHAREDGKKIRIAFANFSDEAVFGAVVLKGIKDAAKAHDNLELTYYDNRQDAAKSIENARTIVATRPDFVVWFCSSDKIARQRRIQTASRRELRRPSWKSNAFVPPMATRRSRSCQAKQDGSGCLAARSGPNRP